MVPESSHLTEITEAVWCDFLGIYVKETADGFADSECAALIGIAGEWNGTVAVGCSKHLAKRAAASMFSGSENTISDHQLQDALNEVVNIIGGNVKSLLPGPSYLALPNFVDNWVPPQTARGVSFKSGEDSLHVLLIPVT